MCTLYALYAVHQGGSRQEDCDRAHLESPFGRVHPKLPEVNLAFIVHTSKKNAVLASYHTSDAMHRRYPSKLFFPSGDHSNHFQYEGMTNFFSFLTWTVQRTEPGSVGRYIMDVGLLSYDDRQGRESRGNGRPKLRPRGRCHACFSTWTTPSFSLNADHSPSASTTQRPSLIP